MAVFKCVCACLCLCICRPCRNALTTFRKGPTSTMLAGVWLNGSSWQLWLGGRCSVAIEDRSQAVVTLRNWVTAPGAEFFAPISPKAMQCDLGWELTMVLGAVRPVGLSDTVVGGVGKWGKCQVIFCWASLKGLSRALDIRMYDIWEWGYGPFFFFSLSPSLA